MACCKCARRIVVCSNAVAPQWHARRVQVFDDWKAFASRAAAGAGDDGEAVPEPRLSNVTLAFLEACCREQVRMSRRSCQLAEQRAGHVRMVQQLGWILVGVAQCGSAARCAGSCRLCSLADSAVI